MPPPSRPAFDSYSLPLPQRRDGPAAALSFLVHVAIAILVLWRGAALFASAGGGGAGPALSWFALPNPPASQADAVRQAPAVTVPTAAAPVVEPVKLDVPPRVPAITIAPLAPVGTGEGTAGGPGE